MIHVLSYIQRQSLMLLLLMLSNNAMLFLSLWFYHSAAYRVHISTEVKLRIWAAVSSDNGNNCFLQSVYNLQFSRHAHTITPQVPPNIKEAIMRCNKTGLSALNWIRSGKHTVYFTSLQLCSFENRKSE